MKSKKESPSKRPDVRAKIAKALKGRVFSETHRRKLSEAHKGKVLSEEHKRKIGDARKGLVFSEEHKKRIGETKRSKKLSDKGLANISKAQKGRKHSKEEIEKQRKGHKGYKHSEETKEKMRSHIPWNKGKINVYTEKQLEVLRARRLERKIPTIDTSIELKVKEQLERRGIFFVHPFNLENRFQCDFFLPSQNLIIECDGNYWHSREDMKRRDVRKDAYAKKYGYNLLRIPEDVINAPDFCVEDLIKKKAVSVQYRIDNIT